MDRDLLKQALQNNRIQKLQSSNRPQPQMPSMTQMASNVVDSIARNIKSVASGNELNVSTAEAQRRLAICGSCEFFNSEAQRCGKCGCYMAVKTYLKAEACPVGKW